MLTTLLKGKTGVELYAFGRVHVLDDRVFVDDLELSGAVRQFGERYCELYVVFPEEFDYEVDEKIKPLVAALQIAGVRTVASCQGHMEERRSELIRYPYVSCYVDNPEAWSRVLDCIDLSIWEVVQYRAPLRRIRTKAEATTEEGLEKLQERANELAATIRALVS